MRIDEIEIGIQNWETKNTEEKIKKRSEGHSET